MSIITKNYLCSAELVNALNIFNTCTISSTASLGLSNELLRVNLQGKLPPIRYTLRCWGQVTGLMCWGTRVTTWSQFHLDAFSHHPCPHGGKVSYSRKTQNSPCTCCCTSGPVPSQYLLTSVWSHPADPGVFIGRGKNPKMASVTGEDKLSRHV